MDLKIKDVATLLHVSEATIRRWIAESKIPYYRLNRQFRFSRSEIENWVLSAQQEGSFSLFSPEEIESLKQGGGTQQFGLYRAIHKGGLYRNVSGKTKEEVIRSAVEQMASDLCLDADVISELVLDREKLMSTALSRGVAVPHTRDFLLQESFDVVSIVFLKEPIEYGALDGQPVHTLFFLFACDDRRHLHLLAKLAHLSNKSETLETIRQASSKEALLAYIKEWEMEISKLPASRSALSVS